MLGNVVEDWKEEKNFFFFLENTSLKNPPTLFGLISPLSYAGKELIFSPQKVGNISENFQDLEFRGFNLITEEKKHEQESCQVVIYYSRIVYFIILLWLFCFIIPMLLNFVFSSLVFQR